jgi:hypothetical protein
MKIQNKYVFRTIISEFLYFQKGAWVWHDCKAQACGSGMDMRPRRLGTPWFWARALKSGIAVRPEVFGSSKKLSGGLKINSLG